ncbi:MAG: hypothetical protein KJZ87_02430 [Thermoguttaceae bacterium]|nr:hypothetical protein [Thermoguttaceae bacterium]
MFAAYFFGCAPIQPNHKCRFIERSREPWRKPSGCGDGFVPNLPNGDLLIPGDKTGTQKHASNVSVNGNVYLVPAGESHSVTGNEYPGHHVGDLLANTPELLEPPQNDFRARIVAPNIGCVAVVFVDQSTGRADDANRHFTWDAVERGAASVAANVFGERLRFHSGNLYYIKMSQSLPEQYRRLPRLLVRDHAVEDGPHKKGIGVLFQKSSRRYWKPPTAQVRSLADYCQRRTGDEFQHRFGNFSRLVIRHIGPSHLGRLLYAFSLDRRLVNAKIGVGHA